MVQRSDLATINAMTLATIRGDTEAYQELTNDMDRNWQALAMAAVAMLASQAVLLCRAKGMPVDEFLERQALIYASLPEKLEDVEDIGFDA